LKLRQPKRHRKVKKSKKRQQLFRQRQPDSGRKKPKLRLRKPNKK